MRGAAADVRADSGNASQTITAYRNSLRGDPTQSLVWSRLGCAEAQRGEHAAAAACLREAVKLEPGWHEARHNLGVALFQLGRIEEALSEFRAAARGPRAELPLSALAQLIPGDGQSDNQAILDARRSWAARHLPEPRGAERFAGREPSIGTPRESEPLRVGYVSSFFDCDNWLKPMWALINQHDRTVFQLHFFSDGPASSIGAAYRAHPSDRFHDISGLTNEAAADAIEHCGIDLLIDLNGYSAMGRLAMVALRPAPVVAGCFSLYATSGIAAYDVLIGDDDVVPPDEERFYSERIERVPGSFLTFEVGYAVPPVAPPPWAANEGIAFGCLAPLYKITDAVVRAWSSILAQVPRSTLLLRSVALSSAATAAFVHERFAQHGIPPERIVLRGAAPHYAFLQTYAAIDVALDTFPYNGGTTTMEALWQGVPVVTFRGDRWVSRTSTSLLRAGGLHEFVCDDVDGYVSLAVRLGTAAGARAQLARLRRTMRARLRTSPVCDTTAFARNMERIYRDITAPGYLRSRVG